MDRALKVVGIADSQDHAEAIIASLHAAGFALDRVSALLNDSRATVDFAHDQGIGYPPGATEGAASGSVVGGTLGVLAGLGLAVVPGLGPFIGGGPILAALSGLAFGGLLGALVGFGIPKAHAGRYEQELRAGRILLVIDASDVREANRATQVLVSSTARQVLTLERDTPTSTRPGSTRPQ